MPEITAPAPFTTFGTNTARQGANNANSLGQLGEGDFLRLMTVQLQQQDPFEPVDNSQMLAQMAQFTSLASATKTNDTLQQISAKLDALIAVQGAVPVPTTTPIQE